MNDEYTIERFGKIDLISVQEIHLKLNSCRFFEWQWIDNRVNQIKKAECVK